MKGIFSRKRVAVIGVSAKPDNLGRNIMLDLSENPVHKVMSGTLGIGDLKLSQH